MSENYQAYFISNADYEGGGKNVLTEFTNEMNKNHFKPFRHNDKVEYDYSTGEKWETSLDELMFFSNFPNKYGCGDFGAITIGCFDRSVSSKLYMNTSHTQLFGDQPKSSYYTLPSDSITIFDLYKNLKESLQNDIEVELTSDDMLKFHVKESVSTAKKELWIESNFLYYLTGSRRPQSFDDIQKHNILNIMYTDKSLDPRINYAIIALKGFLPDQPRFRRDSTQRNKKTFKSSKNLARFLPVEAASAIHIKSPQVINHHAAFNTTQHMLRQIGINPKREKGYLHFEFEHPLKMSIFDSSLNKFTLQLINASSPHAIKRIPLRSCYYSKVLIC